jgi:FkbM family methyltransferase
MRRIARALVHPRRTVARLRNGKPPPKSRRRDMVPVSGPITMRGVTFRIDLDLDPYMAAMFRGTYGAGIRPTLARLLREGDTMLDIGASVGYVTALGMGFVGRSGAVHAFEPVPAYFSRLDTLRRDNPGYRLFTNEVAMGEGDGVGRIDVSAIDNIGWNTMVPGMMPESHRGATLEVRVTTVDAYLAAHPVTNLRLIKIDTEGYEYPVLLGALATLDPGGVRPFVIVEVAPAAYPILGATLTDLARLIDALGYEPWDMALKRRIDVTQIVRTRDVVLVPDGAGLPLPLPSRHAQAPA